MTESLLITTVAGAIIVGVTQFSKGYGFATRDVLAFTVVAVGAIYTAFTMFVAPEIQTQVVQFATQSLGIAIVLYEFVYKNIVD